MIEIISANILKNISERRSRRKRSARQTEVAQQVAAIIDHIAKEGLPALLSYIKQFDAPQITEKNLWVTEAEIDAAHAMLADEDISALRLAIKLISDYHAKQVPQGWEMKILSGSTVGMRYSPIERVGVYVPGGRALYPSTVLMNVIPARLAGVPDIIMTTPPGRDGNVFPLILATAKELGLTKILKAGGAHAVAGLALGWEGFQAVDKIVGPGNAYVTEAKRLVYGLVGIDKLAGPSDVTVLADESAVVSRIAWELLAQAEHDPDSEVFLVTTHKPLAEAVLERIRSELFTLPRKSIIEQAFKNSAIFMASSMTEAYAAVNALAPEHLQLMVTQPRNAVFYIHHAGAIFMGNDSPVALGDYMIGPNHVLPTSGTARYASPLSVFDFLKSSSLIQVSPGDRAALAPDVQRLAQLEGLEAHARSVAT